MAIRILLADDHLVVRQGLRSLLENHGFDVVGEASDGREAVRMAQKLRPGIAVLDLAMPLLNGLGAARELHRVCPWTKSILLTMHKDHHYVIESFRAGIRGYVLKSQAASDLIQAIREVSKKEIYLSPGISRPVVEALLSNTAPDPDALSPREREVLQLIAEGKTAKQVAQLLNLSVKTIDSHRTNIMKKLDLHETAGLVRYAIRTGLIQP
jgi:two-component system, NarL family, response regulator NreC